MTSSRLTAVQPIRMYGASAAKYVLGSLLLAGTVFYASQARAGDVRLSIGVNLPGVSVVAAQPYYRHGSRLVVPQGYVLGADGVLYPQQVVVQRSNYYVQPAPVFVPRQVYVQPIRGYVAPVYSHSHGHGYSHGYHHGYHQGHHGHGNNHRR